MEPSKELKQAVSDYKNGREEAFTTLYEESERYIYVCISKIMRGCDNLPDVVSDLMQDTYVEISRHISQLENVESFLNWAGTIATRQCYAYLKKNSQYILLPEEDDTLDELVADEELIPETIMQDREKQRLVRQMIDTELTPIQRLCVIAYYFNEQKQSEIAHDLGIPENTVKTHLSRAKAKIRESVLELEKKEGTKLYSAAPFLLLLLSEEIRECVVPEQIAKMILSAGNEGVIFVVGAGAKTAAAAGKGGAIAAGKTGAAAALKIKIAAAVIGVGTLAAVGGGILLNQNSQPETPDEIQEEYGEGKKEENFMGYQFRYPESVELELNGDGYYFRYHSDIAALVQVPVDSFLFSKNITDLKEAPAASEKYVFGNLETSVSELFDPDATTQTITSSEVRTINGIEMLRVEGFFTNTQKERDVEFVGYYFFTEVTPAFQTFSTPFYVIGIPLNDEADAASFMDEFAEGITKNSEGTEDEEMISDEETSKTASFYDGQRVVYVLYHRWDGDYDDNDVDMVMMYSPEPDGTYTSIFIGDSSFLKGLFSLEEGLPSNEEMFAMANKYIEEWTDLPDHTIYEREGTDKDHPYFRKQIQGYENSSFCWEIEENCEIDPGVVAPMESKTLERIELGGREYFVVEKGKWLMEITDDIKDVEYFPHVTELE